MTRRSIVLLLLATDFEMLAALQHNLVLEGALSALETEHDLLGGLSLLVEDGLSLATETRLLAVITTLACALVLDRCARHPSDTSAARNERSVPCAKTEALPVLYWVTLWLVCFLHFLLGQKVLRVLGTLTYAHRSEIHQNEAHGSAAT